MALGKMGRFSDRVCGGSVGRHLHVNCFSGISGDMMLGALVDAGLSWAALVNGLKRLKLSGYQLRKREVRRGALPAIKVDVLIRQGFRHALSLSRIRRILDASTLPEVVKQQSRAVFDRLAEAEAVAHRVKVREVHFHEVGVMDSLIDVVGGVFGCHLLNVTRVTASAINVGSGTVRTNHGLLPVPGPAVVALTKDIPIYAEGPPRELATPTGVALLRTLVSEFGPLSVIPTASIGYGAGDGDPEGWPNVLRVFLSAETQAITREMDRVMQIETNLDDVNPQAYDYVMELLFAVGALDVAIIPVIMKRSRPGVILSCLVARDHVDPVLDVLFQETTALGVRIQEVDRLMLSRRFVPVPVTGGTVRMKVADIGAGWTKAAPEYADCRTLAIRTGRPLRAVMEEARAAYARVQRRTGGSPL